MQKVPNGRYTKEFRAEAVKLVTEGGFTAYEASRRLSVPKSTLENWVRAEKKGVLSAVGKSQRPLTEVEVELAQVKRELAQVKMERDLLKKAAAYFAKESLPGTR
jgi:transposase